MIILCLSFLGAAHILLFVALPLALAFRESIKKTSNKFLNSKLYVGRVWHTRFLPKKHAFTYPIFLFAIDLEEEMDNFFSPVLSFREIDHLKNGEGISSSSSAEKTDNSLAQRVLRLVHERTKGKCQPSLETHRVTLLTHLCYYGYNFNPVSFYYVVSKETNELTTMVAEVSNTPWTEMHCYVLHPASVDKVSYRKKGRSDWFSFPKVFHVSPFMEMDYMYDFGYTGLPNQEDPASPLMVINQLRNLSDDKLAFSAKLSVTAQPITPLRVAWQLIRFPVFCMILQIWIHYQAAWLFIKGIVFVPHPDGSETEATKAIATFMAPFFVIRDSVGIGTHEADKKSEEKVKKL